MRFGTWHVFIDPFHLVGLWLKQEGRKQRVPLRHPETRSLNCSEIRMLLIHKFIKSVIHGVAFVPLLITLLATILALMLTLSPGLQDLNGVMSTGGYFEVKKPETARAILSSLLTGMVSLTVFGFSMMMVVVNQASSNYSPKVVETLTLKRSNQYILGIYLGTIVFTLVVMMHIDSTEVSGGIPQVALLVNMLLSVYSMLLFVRFINNISNSVRISTIIEKIYEETKVSMRKSPESCDGKQSISVDEWATYNANHSGYFQVIRIKPLLKLLVKEGLCLAVIPLRGQYYTARTPLFRLSRQVDDACLNSIRSHFITYPGEVISENFMFGFRQLSEVAVKALSPGINDAGVARLCIDYLGELLRIYLSEEGKNTIIDDSGKVRILIHQYTFADIVDCSMTPIKPYSAKDYTIIICILRALQTVSLYDDLRTRQPLLNAYAVSLLQDAKQKIFNFIERKRINDVSQELNASGYFHLKMLQIANNHLP